MKVSFALIISLLLVLPSLVRSQPGTLDFSFSGDGYTQFNFRTSDDASATLVQPDGKILVLGNANPGPDIILMRLNPDGSLDSTFDGNGIATDFLYYFNDIGTCLALQPDGKILVGGYNFNSSSVRRAAVWRVNPDGSFDTSFGTNGIAEPDLSPSVASEVNVIAIQPNGRILMTGTRWISSNFDYKPFVARLDISGTLDPSFSGDGKYYVPNINGYSWLYGVSIGVQSSGNIIGAVTTNSGGSNYGIGLFRLTSQGTPDQSFGNGLGYVNPGGNKRMQARAMVIDSVDRILVAGDGQFFDTTDEEFWYLDRLNSDGSQDNTFASSASNYPIGNFPNYGFAGLKALALQNDGKILVGGSRGESGSFEEAVLARFSTDGTIDLIFNNGGLIALDYQIMGRINSLAVQPDGRIIASGLNSGDLAVARIFDRYVVGREEEMDLGPSVEFFPNPTHLGQGTLTYELAEAGKVSIVLFDLAGHQLETYPNSGLKAPGLYHETISLDAMPAGCYLLKVKSGNSISTIKVMHQPGF